MRLIGLTGGIASGKSTVARMFRALGAPVIDADQLAREVVEPGTPALADIAARWPDVVSGGQLDRKKLGAKIFADPAERAALNAITHPRIQAAALQRTRTFAEFGAPAVIYEAALIVENELDAGMNGLIVVHVPESVQLARLRARDGIGEAEARQRLSAQLPLAEKLKRATWVVDNAGSEDATRAEVERIWREILAAPE